MGIGGLHTSYQVTVLRVQRIAIWWYQWPSCLIQHLADGRALTRFVACVCQMPTLCPATLGRSVKSSASQSPHSDGDSCVSHEDLLPEVTENCTYDSISQRTRHTKGAQYLSIYVSLGNVFKPQKFTVVRLGTWWHRLVTINTRGKYVRSWETKPANGVVKFMILSLRYPDIFSLKVIKSLLSPDLFVLPNWGWGVETVFTIMGWFMEEGVWKSQWGVMSVKMNRLLLGNLWTLKGAEKP